MINFTKKELSKIESKLKLILVNIIIVVIMSKANVEILDLLNKIVADMDAMKIAIKELQEDNASAAVNGEKMYKALNAKFDLFKNLEAQSRETIQQTTTTSRKLTRPAFFKKLFIEEREKYLNVLYTQEEIDAAFEEKEVAAKKKEADRISKAVTLIYTKHIKANNPEGRASAFASLYEQSLSN